MSGVGGYRNQQSNIAGQFGQGIKRVPILNQSDNCLNLLALRLGEENSDRPQFQALVTIKLIS
jgi:hypothetical protein